MSILYCFDILNVLLHNVLYILKSVFALLIDIFESADFTLDILLGNIL